MTIDARKHSGTATPIALLALALALGSLPPAATAASNAATKKEPNTMKTSTAPLDPAPTTGSDAIRPFQVHVPDADIADLRRRIAATRWPDKETVSDRSQGAPLDPFQKLVRYWGTSYD